MTPKALFPPGESTARPAQQECLIVWFPSLETGLVLSLLFFALLEHLHAVWQENLVVLLVIWIPVGAVVVLFLKSRFSPRGEGATERRTRQTTHPDFDDAAFSCGKGRQYAPVDL